MHVLECYLVMKTQIRVYHSSIYICPSNKLYLRNLGFCGLQFEKLNKKLVTVITLLPVLITQ